MLCDRARVSEIQLLWRRTIKFVSAELSLIVTINIAIIVTNTSGQANTLLYDFFFLYKNLNLSEIWIVCKLQIDSAPIVIPTPSIAFCTSILSIEHMIWWRICRILPPHSLKCCMFIHAFYIWAICFFFIKAPPLLLFICARFAFEANSMFNLSLCYLFTALIHFVQ